MALIPDPATDDYAPDYESAAVYAIGIALSSSYEATANSILTSHGDPEGLAGLNANAQGGVLDLTYNAPTSLYNSKTGTSTFATDLGQGDIAGAAFEIAFDTANLPTQGTPSQNFAAYRGFGDAFAILGLSPIFDGNHGVVGNTNGADPNTLVNFLNFGQLMANSYSTPTPFGHGTVQQFLNTQTGRDFFNSYNDYTVPNGFYVAVAPTTLSTVDTAVDTIEGDSPLSGFTERVNAALGNSAALAATIAPGTVLDTITDPDPYELSISPLALGTSSDTAFVYDAVSGGLFEVGTDAGSTLALTNHVIVETSPSSYSDATGTTIPLGAAVDLGASNGTDALAQAASGTLTLTRAIATGTDNGVLTDTIVPGTTTASASFADGAIASQSIASTTYYYTGDNAVAGAALETSLGHNAAVTPTPRRSTTTQVIPSNTITPVPAAPTSPLRSSSTLVRTLPGPRRKRSTIRPTAVLRVTSTTTPPAPPTPSSSPTTPVRPRPAPSSISSLPTGTVPPPTPATPISPSVSPPPSSTTPARKPPPRVSTSPMTVTPSPVPRPRLSTTPAVPPHNTSTIPPPASLLPSRITPASISRAQRPRRSTTTPLPKRRAYPYSISTPP